MKIKIFRKHENDSLKLESEYNEFALNNDVRYTQSHTDAVSFAGSYEGIITLVVYYESKAGKPAMPVAQPVAGAVSEAGTTKPCPKCGEPINSKFKWHGCGWKEGGI